MISVILLCTFCVVNELVVSFPVSLSSVGNRQCLVICVWYVLYDIMKTVKMMWQKIVQHQAGQSWEEEANVCNQRICISFLFLMILSTTVEKGE